MSGRGLRDFRDRSIIGSAKIEVLEKSVPVYEFLGEHGQGTRYRPYGGFIHPETGKVYITEHNNQRLDVYSSFGGPREYAINLPYEDPMGCCYDYSTGGMLVAFNSSTNVLLYPDYTQGNYSTLFNIGFADDIEVNPFTGNILVLDGYVVKVLDRSGTELSQFYDLTYTSGVCVHPVYGFIIITVGESPSPRFVVFRSEEDPTIIYEKDGIPFTPSGISVTSDSEMLLINQFSPQAIRKSKMVESLKYDDEYYSKFVGS